MNTNWTKFGKAFNQVSAFVVLDTLTQNIVAKIALKHPNNGAGRLSCYLHIIGTEMQIGTASGYGYDKRTASIINASDKIIKQNNEENLNMTDKQNDFLKLLASDDAELGWQEVINEYNGFTVIQVI